MVATLRTLRHSLPQSRHAVCMFVQTLCYPFVTIFDISANEWVGRHNTTINKLQAAAEKADESEESDGEDEVDENGDPIIVRKSSSKKPSKSSMPPRRRRHRSSLCPLCDERRYFSVG